MIEVQSHPPRVLKMFGEAGGGIIIYSSTIWGGPGQILYTNLELAPKMQIARVVVEHKMWISAGFSFFLLTAAVVFVVDDAGRSRGGAAHPPAGLDPAGAAGFLQLKKTKNGARYRVDLKQARRCRQHDFSTDHSDACGKRSR